jgi:acyl-CoA reductase-like NAD-dependent aldehyde dehydrogenase
VLGDPFDDGTTMGPLVNQAQLARVMRLSGHGRELGWPGIEASTEEKTITIISERQQA